MSDIFADTIMPNRRLGQVFLTNDGIAAAEAAHSTGKTVLEIGPGHGILTKELCKGAKRVIAVEKDHLLCKILKVKIKSRRLELIEGDFLELDDKELGTDSVDIVIANIPYYLSSTMIDWLSERKLEAVLCLQKEFVGHMLAKPEEHNYSKLSVMSSLLYRIVKIMDIPKGNFRPVPKVDSVLIYMKPKGIEISERERFLIGLLMQHKKKTVRNAIIDSHSYLKMEKDRLRQVADKISEGNRRLFAMEPAEILELSRKLDSMLK